MPSHDTDAQEPLVPTKTMRTAAYVAVATNLFSFVVRIPSDNAVANRITETVVVIRLLFPDGLSAMMSIGTTRAAPAENASRARASLSTNDEVISGVSRSKYSSTRRLRSSFVQTNFLGRCLLRKSWRGSCAAIFPVFKLQYRDLYGTPGNLAISGKYRSNS